MPRYLIILNSTESTRDTMSKTTPEQMKLSMDEWIAWKEAAEKTVKFEFGNPLQAVGSVTRSGISDSSSKAAGYFKIEGEAAELFKLLPTHPHLKRPGATMDMLEVVTMPGMTHEN